MGNRLTLFLLLAAALCASGAFYWLSSSGRSSPTTARSPEDPRSLSSGPSGAEEPAATLVDAGPLAETPPAETPRRVEVTEPARPAPAPDATEPVPSVRGRVQDRFGTPIAGARVIGARSSGFWVDLETESDVPWLQRVSTETDAAGSFELSGLDAGSVRLAVRAHGFAPFDKDGLRLPEKSTLELEPLILARGAVLSGLVVDASGRGVAGAKLIRQDPEHREAFFLGPDRAATAVTAADGSFRIDELACGAWRILVRSEEHPDLSVEGLAEEPGVEQGGLRWQLPPGAEIAGRVTDVPPEERGQLEARAARSGSGPEFFGPARRAEVRGDGAFTLRGLEPGREYELQARRKERAGAFEFWERSRSQTVRARAGDTGVVLSYQPEAALAFQVLDARTRAPLESFQVEAGTDWVQPQRDDSGRVRTIYPEGRVRIGGLRPSGPDERVQFVVNATGYREYRREDVAVLAGQELDLGALFLEPVPVLRVHVVDDRGGEPVAGASVRLEKDGGDHMEIRRTLAIGADDESETIEIGGTRAARTDEQGRAELTSFEGETCRLSVRSKEHAPREITGLFLPAGEVVEQEVRLTRGGEVLVHVQDAAGEPLTGVRVEHRSDSAGSGVIVLGGRRADSVTDSAGEVLFTNLEAGLHSFRLDEGGAGGMFVGRDEEFVIAGLEEGALDEGWSEVQVAEGERSEVTLQASPRGSLSGRVREAGKLLAGATLRLSGAGRQDEGREFHFPGMSAGPEARSDGEGRYLFEDVKEGDYRLVVEHPTRRMPQEFALEVRAGENSFDVDLSLSVLEGRVVDQEAKPLAGVRVWPERLQEEDGRHMRFAFVIGDGGDGGVFHSGNTLGGQSVYTDADGRYSLRGVESDVELVVRAEGDMVQPKSSESLRVAPDETRRGVDLELEAGGAIAVEAELADGAPARFCMVNATYAGEEQGVEPKFSFIQSGSTTLKGLKPGLWRVNVRRAGPENQEDPGEEQELEVKAGETVSGTFRME